MARAPDKPETMTNRGTIEALGATMRVGIISDTHGLLRPDAMRQLAQSDHIIHAGDIGAPGVIDGLRAIAPTTAIRGNVDAGAWANEYPDTELVV